MSPCYICGEYTATCLCDPLTCPIVPGDRGPEGMRASAVEAQLRADLAAARALLADYESAKFNSKEWLETIELLGAQRTAALKERDEARAALAGLAAGPAKGMSLHEVVQGMSPGDAYRVGYGRGYRDADTMEEMRDESRAQVSERDARIAELEGALTAYWEAFDSRDEDHQDDMKHASFERFINASKRLRALSKEPQV